MSRTENHDRIHIPDVRNHWRGIVSNRRLFHRNNNVRSPSRNRIDSISYKDHVGRLVLSGTIVHFLTILHVYGRGSLARALKNHLRMLRPTPNHSDVHILRNERYERHVLGEDDDYGEHALQRVVVDGYDDGLSYDVPPFDVSAFDV